MMVPCFSPLLLIILIPAAWNMRFISSGVAVVAKSTSSGRLPDRRSRTAPPAILNSNWCFSNRPGSSRHTEDNDMDYVRCWGWWHSVYYRRIMRIGHANVIPATAFNPSDNKDWNSQVCNFMVKRLRVQIRCGLLINSGLIILPNI